MPTGIENPSPNSRVRPKRGLLAEVVPSNMIETPPRVEPPRRSARIEDLVRQEWVEKLQDKGPAHRTISHTHTVSQEAMLTRADIMQLNMSPRKLAGQKFPIEMINTVLNKETGEVIEYQQVRKNPKYCRLYETAYSKELGRLAQGMSRQAEGTNTLFFIDKNIVPVKRWRDITYIRVVVN